MIAVVADASALGLESLVDAAFAGRVVDVEKEFAKASVAGTSPVAIVGTALRQIERLHRCGSTSRAAPRHPPWSRASTRFTFAASRWSRRR